MWIRYRPLVIGCLCGVLFACGGNDDDVEADLQIDRSSAGFVASFDLTAKPAQTPSPFDLAFIGSTDGTLNIAVSDEQDFSDPKVALNTLDGFSTVAPIQTRLNLPLDAASLSADSVQLYRVVTVGEARAVQSVVAALDYGVDYLATVSPFDPQQLTISLLTPLQPASSYLVVLTNKLRSRDGRVAAAEQTYQILQSTTSLVSEDGSSAVLTLEDAQAQALEPLRQLVNAQQAALQAYGQDISAVALSWTFTTQSIGRVLAEAKKLSAAATASALTELELPDLPYAQQVNVYTGELTLPYYLSDGSMLPTDPLNRFWQGRQGSYLTQFNPVPQQTSYQSVPLLVSVPKSGQGPWPVVIYQHGISRNRSDLLVLADTFAQAGFAAVAIDLPLHGLLPGQPFYQAGKERTFDLDLINNTTVAPGADGMVDASGSHFINLQNLLLSRDNMRQGSADLMALYQVLDELSYSGNGGDFNSEQVYFVGHSLGAIVGASFLSLQPEVHEAVLAMGGTGIAKLLDGSASFGPAIAAGLAAAGVDKGSADYEAFMGAAQTVMDSVDPVNYTSALTADRGVLMLEVVGNADSLPDQVIPNNVTTLAAADTIAAPLSGTDPWGRLLGLTLVSQSRTSEQPQNAWIRYTQGEHSSLLDTAAAAEVTQGMHAAMASFLASAGRQLTIADEALVE